MTKYNHASIHPTTTTLREIVFGMEDGMVSTLGVITGIAIGSQDHFIVLLSGTIIIAVESISMGVGSYLANRSEIDLRKRLINEEREEITEYPSEEQSELKIMFERDGWPNDIAQTMSDVAKKDKKLMLKEMAYRELHIAGGDHTHPFKNGLKMFFSYIAGGIVPLIAYFIWSVSIAMPISITLTLIGLFALGAIAAKFTKTSWLIGGTRILVMGGIAMGIGLAVGFLLRGA